MSCAICCEAYKQDPIICGFCDFAACNTCCETYILDQTTPKCMNTACGKDWSRKFLKAKLGGTFMTGKFKTHMEDVLYDREKALMPATQPLVERKLKGEKLKNELNLIKEQIANLEMMKARLEHNITRHRNGEELIENWEGDRTRYYTWETPPTASCAAAPAKNNYVRACPAEDCRGFLNQKWICGLCDKKTCRNCHEIINGDEKEHVCDPNNVATAQLLEKDTKPCPQCQTMIFKIDGCDQMWCTQCHTAFSWKTGNIEKTIHNPHYYEWKRNNGGLEPNAAAAEPVAAHRNGCYEITQETSDELMRYTKIYSHKNLRWEEPSGKYNVIVKYDPNFQNVIDMPGSIIHNQQIEMPRFRSDIFKNNEELRVKFMSNEITEEQFKTLVQRNDKKSRKNEEITDIFQFFHATMNELANRMLEDLKTTCDGYNNFNQIFGEMEALREYCNNSFSDISETYDSVLYNFDETYKFITVKSEKDNAKLAKKLENQAHTWLNRITYVSNLKSWDPENPTACRIAALKYANNNCWGRRIPNWMSTSYNPETRKEVWTCDMTV